MDIVTIIVAIAGLFGAALGAGALVSPGWAAKFVRMQADPAQPDGYAEFRATFGGVFLALHAALLVALFTGFGFIGASAMLCAGWAGAAGGRVLSLLLDGSKGVRTRHNYVSIIVEVVMAIVFALPVYNFIQTMPG